jgi:hypothetical protein
MLRCCLAWCWCVRVGVADTLALQGGKGGVLDACHYIVNVQNNVAHPHHQCVAMP